MNISARLVYKAAKVSEAYRAGLHLDPASPFVTYRTDYEREAYLKGLADRTYQQS